MASVPGPSPGMQPMALQSLSELERASLQELALFRLQERLPVGHLTLDRGTGTRGWEGREGMGWEALPRGAEAEPHAAHPRTAARGDGYGKTFVTYFVPFYFSFLLYSEPQRPDQPVEGFACSQQCENMTLQTQTRCDNLTRSPLGLSECPWGGTGFAVWIHVQH